MRYRPLRDDHLADSRPEILVPVFYCGVCGGELSAYVGQEFERKGVCRACGEHREGRQVSEESRPPRAPLAPSLSERASLLGVRLSAEQADEVRADAERYAAATGLDRWDAEERLLSFLASGGVSPP